MPDDYQMEREYTCRRDCPLKERGCDDVVIVLVGKKYRCSLTDTLSRDVPNGCDVAIYNALIKIHGVPK